MVWLSTEEHARQVDQGVLTGTCPGCGRKTDTLASIVLGPRETIGVCCADCIDGETIERLDPRQDARAMRDALLESRRRWRARQR